MTADQLDPTRCAGVSGGRVINRYSNDAWNVNNDSIWAAQPYNVERQPDGVGAAIPVLASWEGNTGAAGGYQID